MDDEVCILQQLGCGNDSDKTNKSEVILRRFDRSSGLKQPRYGHTHLVSVSVCRDRGEVGCRNADNWRWVM